MQLKDKTWRSHYTSYPNLKKMKRLCCLLFVSAVLCLTKALAQPPSVSPCDNLSGSFLSPTEWIWSSPEFTDSIFSWTSYDVTGAIIAHDTLSQTHIVPISLPLDEGDSFTICAEYWLSNWDWDGLEWCCVAFTWENGTLVGNPVQPLATDKHEPLSVLIYPNPASNNLTVDLGDLNGINTTIKLYDASSKLVFEKQSSSTLMIDVSGFAKGMYSLELTTEDQVLRSQVIFE